MKRILQKHLNIYLYPSTYIVYKKKDKVMLHRVYAEI